MGCVLAAARPLGVGCALRPVAIVYTATSDLPAWSGFLNGLLAAKCDNPIVALISVCHAALMDLATGQGYIARALEINHESIAYANNIQTQLARQLAARRTAPTLSQLSAQLHELLRGVLEKLFSQVDEIIALVESALKVEEILPLGDQCWQSALICLATEANTLIEVCRGDARKNIRKSKHLARAWSKKWDARADALIDRIDDLAETISLGLNVEIRTELQERIRNLASGQRA